jgi:hypothetical protein
MPVRNMPVLVLTFHTENAGASAKLTTADPDPNMGLNPYYTVQSVI